ncbi:MAG TPA: hypothetical protein PLR84_11215 [Chitinophagales bacterium]|nr:hypothetical protein [Chitinophagales bacterium]HRG35018.1 hypothetical protein [Chitinophagales bacterium]
MKTNNNNNFWLIVGIILSAVAFRIVSNAFSLFNFTPIIAVALFAGAKFKETKWAIFVPIISLFISDAILAYINNFDVFHNTILFTYGSILLIILLGKLLNDNKINVGKTIAVTLSSSLLFFILSNFGTWMFGTMFTHDMSGLIKCFIMAILFNKYSWLGDLFFVFAMFGIYETISNKIAITTKA